MVGWETAIPEASCYCAMGMGASQGGARSPVRVVGPLLLALGALTLLIGLVGHFIRHPGEFAHPWLLLGSVGAVPDVFSHLSAHPTTVLGSVAALLIISGCILIAVRHRAHRAQRQR